MRSTFRILFYLARSKAKQDGTVGIMCRITVNGTKACFSTKLYVDPATWIARESQTNGKTIAARRVNRELADIRKGIGKHYKKIFNNMGPLTADRVKISYLGLDRSCRTILQAFEQHNQDYVKQVESGCRSLRTYRVYCMTCRYLREYIHSEYKVKDVALADLQHGFILGFEMYLRKTKNLATNTICHHIYPLRRIIAISQDNGWLVHNPFAGYVIRKEKTERGYLTMREINMLITTEYTSKRHSTIRDYFIFSCFTGVPHIDLRHLTRSNLKKIDGKWWLFYTRQKTSVPCNVRLLDIPLKIVTKYRKLHRGKLLFPMPTLTSVNRMIKTVAQLAGIEKNVSWHLARHSFATEICLMNGVPIETISRMLGHTDIKTTQIYARVSDTIIDRDMAQLSEKLKELSLFQTK